LIIDDDAEVVSYLGEVLEAAGYACHGQTQPRRALEEARTGKFDLVLSDVEMPSLRGPALLAALHAERPALPVVLMTAFGSVDLAVACMKAGAADFITKPFKAEALVHVLGRVLRERALSREVTRLQRQSATAHRKRGLVARSEAMKRVLELAERAARAPTPVLITGESGTGKSALARFLHDASGRAGAFVELNCASLPANLLEAELFGVKRGAYTDAREDRPGLFREAAGGTLFLDEVGELPLEAQPKLLSAVETGRVRPVGDSRAVAVDARLVAATNRPLEEALRTHDFRPDLYYRLNVLRIEVPPLRERRDDIPPLVDACLERVATRLGRSGPLVVDDEARQWLQQQDWPGNVRELLNVLERALTLSGGDVLSLADLRAGAPPQRGAPTDEWSTAVAERWPLERVEKAYVRRMLQALGGNKAEAARVLGIDRRTLYAKLGGDEDA
jgi:DNA-binding NtrC family response regulator